MKPTVIAAKYGITEADAVSLIRSYKLKAKMTPQRLGQDGKPIQFLLSLAEFCSIWIASGQHNNRGVAVGQYVMARKGPDLGHYTADNVFIQLATENSADAKRGKPVKQSTRDKMSATRTGVPKTAESNAKRSESMAAVPPLTCPSCGKTGQRASMGRYHGLNGEKCQSKQRRHVLPRAGRYAARMYSAHY